MPCAAVSAHSIRRKMLNFMEVPYYRDAEMPHRWRRPRRDGERKLRGGRINGDAAGSGVSCFRWRRRVSAALTVLPAPAPVSLPVAAATAMPPSQPRAPPLSPARPVGGFIRQSAQTAHGRPCNTACTAAPLRALASFAENQTTTPAAIPASRHCAASVTMLLTLMSGSLHQGFYSGN